MVEQNAPHGQQSNPRIAPDDVPVYKALHNPKELAEYVQTLRTNAGVDLLDNLPRCTLPPHGVKEWSIEASEGSRVQETIRGIIVKVLTPRAMWSASPGDDDEKPHPVCSSPDGIRGAGDPGGDCLSCPFNAEDSAPSGTGRACKEKRVLYILQKDSMVPLVVQVPSTSVPCVRQYRMNLAGQKLPYYSVETELTVEEVAGEVPDNRTALRNAGELSQDQRAAVREYIRAFGPVFRQQVGLTMDE